MNAPSQLSSPEQFWLSCLLLLMGSCLVWAFRSRDPRAWMQPPIVMSVILFYYAVAAPLRILSLGEWFNRGANLRGGMPMAWAGAAVSFGAFLAGYGLLRQRLKPPTVGSSFNADFVKRLGLRLNCFALSVFGFVQGGRLIGYLNPFDVSSSKIDFLGFDLGAFSNYALLSVNLLIPGCLLLAAAALKKRDLPLHLVSWLLVAAAIFTSLGFRWRLAVLMASMFMLWCLARRVRPNLTLLIPSVLGILWISGVIGITRTYGKGLDLSKLDGLSILDILFGSFAGESSVFLASGRLMDLVPKSIPYAGATPLINTLLFPLPSALFPAKNSAGYLIDATAVVYGSDVHNAGAAILNYAEYFLIAGWPSLILLSFLLGWLCRRLWLWFRLRGHEPLAQVAYVCNAAYLYMVVSRGYLPQVVMLWCFTAAPLFILYNFVSRKQYRLYRAKIIQSAGLPLLKRYPHLVR